MNRIITISREFGSGGRTIGKEVARRLDIPCYDAELIDKVAEESGFAKEYIKEQGEYASRGGFLANAMAPRSAYFNGGMSNQDYLWVIQRRVILDIAEKESCVIVGRCADYILRDVADCLKVFIHAPIPFRAERIVKLYGESELEPEKRLKDKDKRRASYYRFYTDMEWGRAQNSHISLDSAALGLDTCVDIICKLY